MQPVQVVPTGSGAGHSDGEAVVQREAIGDASLCHDLRGQP